MAKPATFMKARFKGEITAKETPKDVLERVKWQRTSFTYDPDTQDRLKVAWLGHASMFLEFPSSSSSPPPSSSTAVHDGRAGSTSRGLRVLCDPVFSERCSPTQLVGPKRFTPATTCVRDLPEMDVVLLSHNHYDHLDHGTIVALDKRFPELHFFVSLGNKKWFEACGIAGERVSEMDWWEELDFRKRVGDRELGLRIGYLPGQHFTGRWLGDQGTTLWGSFSIEAHPRPGRGTTTTTTSPPPVSPSTDPAPDKHGEEDDDDDDVKRVWFGGDTGRRTIPQSVERGLSSPDAAVRSESQDRLSQLPTCPAHREIGSLRGPFDLAIIPIGAYAPRYLMSPVHVDPAEAVEIFREVGALRGVGIHWGTFSLSAEDVVAPKDTLERHCRAQNLEGFTCWEMGKMMYV